MSAPTKNRTVLLTAICLFFVCLVVYEINGRAHAGVDTIGAPYTAWSMVRHGSLDLNHYGTLERFLGQTIFTLPDGRWINFRPPGVSLAVVPFVAPLALFREEPLSQSAMDQLGKLAAACHIAGAVVLFFLMCRRLIPKAAWPATILFGFGTGVYSVASQAIWQHSPATFWLTLALYLLTDITKELGIRRGLWIGVALGMAILTRPPTVFFLAATGGAFLIQRNWRGLIGLTLSGSLLLAVYCTFNYHYFGDPFRGGYATRDNWDLPTPLWLGVSGLLIAPSRGLLVYSPAFLLLPWGVRHLWKMNARPEQRNRVLVLSWLASSVATLILFAKWMEWRGGWCFGPRFLCETMPLCCLLFGYAYQGLSGRLWLRGVALVLVTASVSVQFIGIYGHAAESEWCIRHERGDQGLCMFELRDTQIEAYSVTVLNKFGRRLGVNTQTAERK